MNIHRQTFKAAHLHGSCSVALHKLKAASSFSLCISQAERTSEREFPSLFDLRRVH